MAATGLLVVAGALLAGTAWRLSQGPIDLGRLSDRVRSAFVDDTGPIRVSFDGVVLAWEGFRKGVDYPLDLRLSGVSVTDPAGRQIVAAPNVHLTVSLAGLVLGRFVPRAIEVDHARFDLTRDAGGAISLGPGSDGDSASGAEGLDLNRLREQLSSPAGSDHGRSRGLFDQIRRAHFRDIEATIRDQASGLIVRTAAMDLELVRERTGPIRGTLRAPLAFGNERADLIAGMIFAPGADASLDVRITPFRPTGLAPLAPATAFLAGVDVPVSFQAAIALDGALKPRHMQVHFELGEGKVDFGQGHVPILHGSAELSGTPAAVTIDSARFELARAANGDPEAVDIRGTIAHQSDRLMASLTVGIDRIDVADLPRFWPPGIGGGARPWIVQHVTGGIATHGSVAAELEADDSLRDVAVTRATGDLDVANATFTWLDDIPPVEQAGTHLHLVDPDTLDIQVASGRQRVRNGGADLLIRDGRIRITGLLSHDQTMVLRTRVDGSVAGAIALLKEPRLHLLSVHPIALKTDAGDASATLDFQFPLLSDLSIDDVQIGVEARLSRLRLLDVAGGQVFDNGAFDLKVDKDGLGFKGTGALAAVPVSLDGTMDFNGGPPDQVVQKVVVTGRPEAAQLDAAGLHVTDVVQGAIPVNVVVTERRGGDGSLVINADLSGAALRIDPLAWTKQAGETATAAGTVVLSHDRVTRIDRVTVRGDGLFLTGSANLPDGQVRSILLDTVRVGRTQGHGAVRLVANQPIGVVLQGDQIDLSAKLSEKSANDPTPNPRPATTPPWTLDARFDRAILANGETAANLLVTASGDGTTIRVLDAIGSTRAEGGFSIRIAPAQGTRRLRVDAKDAGGFLRGLDAVRTMQSGSLTIDATFANRFGNSPLAGNAVIDAVVVKNSPALGKLLQAITLYGLVDVLRGPGMTFSHIVVPFEYDGMNLTIDQAHADNPSLGLTATGSIGLSSGQALINGTIVPAYFFNSMLGQLPLVGKLFSPETGGGVFAARFTLKGWVEDPSISINPISALTPGFLRGIFGVFDDTGARGGGTPATR
jgi:Protein of unknown function/AsmA-like C-terminal region